MRFRRRVTALAAGLTVTAALVPAAEAVRFRRPFAQAIAVRYGFDNNAGAPGCRDYNCGTRCYDGHHGSDFPLALGTTVLAVADGRVAAVYNGCPNYGHLGNTCGGTLGNYVSIMHADGNRSLYAHLQLNSILVTVGQQVRCGQPLGRSASSGSSTGPHLHLAWRRPGGDTDPYRGQCTSSPGTWVNQNGYGEPVGDRCECPAGQRCDDDAPSRDAGAVRDALADARSADAARDLTRPEAAAPDAGADGGRDLPAAEPDGPAAPAPLALDASSSPPPPADAATASPAKGAAVPAGGCGIGGRAPGAGLPFLLAVVAALLPWVSARLRRERRRS